MTIINQNLFHRSLIVCNHALCVVTWRVTPTLFSLCLSASAELYSAQLKDMNCMQQERATRVRVCNYVKISTGRNFPPLQKVVTRVHGLCKMLILLCVHVPEFYFYYWREIPP